jgi:tryptophanyl-tRNA synthetase
MNQLYSDKGDLLFTIPEPKIAAVGAKIMSLQDPLKKMSKSDMDALASVFLDDSAAEAEKKFKRAVTDSIGKIQYTSEQPGVANLLTILGLFSDTPPEVLAERLADQQYGRLKLDTAAACEAVLGPVRQKAAELMSDRGELDRILAKGAIKAQERAAKTLNRVKKQIGLTGLA